MSNIISTSKRNLQETQQEIQKLAKELTVQHKKITNVFLVSNAGKLEFKEKSFTSKLERYLNKIVYKQGLSFDIESNLKQAIEKIELLQKAIQQEDIVSTQSKTVKEDLTLVLNKLHELEKEVNKKRPQKSQITRVQNAIINIQKYIPKNISEIDAALLSHFQNSQIPKPIQQLLRSLDYTQKENLLLAVDQPNEYREVLLSALYSLYFTRTNPEELQSILAEIEKIDPKPQTQEPSPLDKTEAQRELKRFAMIFGDSFIKNTELEGDLDSKIYAASVAEFMKEEKYNESSAGKALHHALDNMVILSQADDANKMIQEALKKSPDQRCLISGGWAKHAIVYEVQKNSDTTYTFRVYNRGEGAEKHLQYKSDFSQRYAPCIGFTNISEKAMFSGFLTHIAKLKNYQDTPYIALPAPDILIDLLLRLHGKVEPIPEGIQQHVKPQQSGTCTYKSIQACLARSMSETEYKEFKLRYKTYCLKKHVQYLEKNMSVMDYNTLRLNYEVLKRANTKFAKLATKVSDISSGTRSTNLMLAESRVIEQKLEKLLTEQERKMGEMKNISAFGSEPISIPYTTALTDVTETNSQSEPNPTLDTKTETILQRIVLSDPLTNFDTFIQILPDIIQLNNNQQEIVLTSWIQKIPVEKLFDGSLKFKTPIDPRYSEIVRTSLQSLSTTLCQNSTGQLFLQYFALQQLYHLIFQQHAKEIDPSKIPSIPSSIFTRPVCKKINEIQTSDPYWTQFIQKVASTTNPLNIKVSLSESRYIVGGPTNIFPDLPYDISNLMDLWWENPSNEKLRTQITMSVESDRKIQEMKIGEEEQQYEKKIQELTLNITTLEKERNQYSPNSPKYSEYRNKITVWQSKITEELSKKSAVRITIEAQTNQYWPHDFLTDSSIRNKFLLYCMFNSIYYSNFLIKHNITIPNGFLQESAYFIEQGASNSVIFEKAEQHAIHIASYCRFDGASGNIEYTLTTPSITYSPITRFDRCAPILAKSKDWKRLYKSHLQQGCNRTTEGDIPQVASAEAKVTPILSDQLIKWLTIRSSKDMQLHSLLSFIERNPLIVTNQEGIHIFYALLFESDILLHEVSNPQSVAQIKDFFRHQVQCSIENQDLSTAANLLWLASQVDSYIKIAQPEKEREQYRPIIDIKTANQIFTLASDSKYADQKAVVYEAFLAASTSYFDYTQSNRPTEKDTITFLHNIFSSVCMTKEHPVAAENTCLMRGNSAQKATVDLMHFLDTHQGMLNSMFQRFRISSIFPDLQNTNSIFDQNNNNPKLTITHQDGTTIATIYVKSGTIQFENQGDVVQPHKPLTDQIFNLLKKNNLASEETRGNFRWAQKDGVIYIDDTLRKARIQYRDSSDPTVLLKRTNDREFYTVQTSNLLSTVLNEHYIPTVKNRTIQLLDRTTLEPILEQKNGEALTSVAPPKQVLVEEIEGNDALKKCIDAFEDLSWRLLYADARNNQIQRIEFPRFHLSFKYDSSTQSFETQDGWKISKNQFFPHMGETTGHIVLEKNSQKRVLIPLLDPQKEEKKALDFQYSYDFDPTKKELRYIEVLMDTNGSITYPTYESRLHIARIYLEKGYLEEAGKILTDPRALITSRPLTPPEQELLNKIIAKNYSGDQSPERLGLQTHALYLLEKNLSIYSPETLRGLEHRDTLIHSFNKSIPGSIPFVSPAEEEFLLSRSISGNIENRIMYLKKISDQSDQPEIEFFSTKNSLSLRQGRATSQNYSKTAPLRETDHIKYRTWRQLDQFPWKNELERTMYLRHPEYLDLLQEEVQHIKTWKTACDSGLIDCLYDMAYFSQNPQIKEQGLNLLNNIPKNLVQIDLEGISPPKSMRQSIPKSSTPSERNRPIRNLLPLQSLGKAPFENIQDVSASYIETQPPSSPSKASENSIFLIDAPETRQDPTIKGKFQKTAEDLSHAQTQKETKYTLQNGVEIGPLELNLREKQAAANTFYVELEQKICDSINLALTYEVQKNFQLIATKQQRQLPSIEEICVIACTIDAKERLQRLYPELTETGQNNLIDAVKKYLIEKKKVQQCQRAIELCSDIQNAEGPSQPILIDQLGKTLESFKVQEDTLHSMQFLMIETLLNIALRQDQIDNITKFAEKMSKKEEVSLQMIMGAGKTSVLQPMLGVLFAKKGQISVVDVPESLFPSVRELLTKTLGSGYDAYIYTPDFDREKAKDVQYLESFKNILEEIKEQGGCLLRTQKSKHAIITGMYEAYEELRYNPTNKELTKRLDLLTEITSMLQIHEVVQIDEQDMSMNSKVIFKFPIGNPKPMPLEQASLLSEILLDIAQDPEISEKISIDFIEEYQKRSNPQYVKKGVPITEESYSSIQEAILEKAVALLSTKIPKLRSPNEQENIKKFLNDPTNNKDLLKEYTENQKNLISTAGIAYRTIFQTSFLRICGAHYGEDPDPNQRLARPYAAPKAPKSTSFANSNELVIYSTQQLLYTGIPRNGVVRMIQELQKEVESELQSSIALTNTKGYKKFRKLISDETILFPKGNEPLPEKTILAFQTAASKDRSMLLEYMQKFVIPQIKEYDESISSTSQTLVGSASVAGGYTGTMHKEILSPRTTACPELGTDGKTILTVTSKIKNGHGTIVCSESSEPNILLQNTIQQFQTDPELFVFIDSGGWLKNISSQEMAQKLLDSKRNGIHGVVYHNTKGELVSYEYDEQNKLREVPLQNSRYSTQKGELITIIAQKYETGTNIPQPSNAKAYMSIRKNMTKRDMLQSVFRMRQILIGQSASIAMSGEVREHIAAAIWSGLPKNVQNGTENPTHLSQDIQKALNSCKKNHDRKTEFLRKYQPDIDAIWRYATANEAIEEQEKNWLAAQQKMREMVEKPIRMALSDKSIRLEDRLELFQEIRGLMIDTSKDDPFTLFTAKKKEQSAQEAIDAIVKKYSDFITKLENMPNNKAAEQALKNFKASSPDQSIEARLRTCVDPKTIAQKIVTSTNSSDNEQERQQETEAEKEIEKEVTSEQQIEIHTFQQPIDSINYIPIVGESPVISTQFGTHSGRKLIKNIPHIDEIFISKNIVNFQYRPTQSQLSQDELSGQSPYYYDPAFFSLQINAQGQKEYIILSRKDAAQLRENMKPDTTNSVAIYSLEGHCVAKTTGTNVENAATDPSFSKMILSMKLITGRSVYTHDEIETIKKWIEEGKIDARELKTYIESTISFRPQAIAQYNGSLLQKLLFQKTSNQITS